MPTFRIEAAGQVVNRSACIAEQHAWNWANNWASKKPNIPRPMRLSQHVAMLTVGPSNTVVTEHDNG